MRKEGKIEKPELNEEQKEAKEGVLEIVKNSKYWMPETEEEIGQEIEKNCQEKLIEMGKNYFVEKLGQLNTGFPDLSSEEFQKQYSEAVIQAGYYKKFINEYNKETGRKVETLNNFWTRITTRPDLLSAEYKEYLSEEEVQKLDDYLKKEFPNRESFKLGEIKKDAELAIKKFYSKKAIEKLKWDKHYDDQAIERVALYALIEKIIKERFNMTREEFADNLYKYFRERGLEELSPKEKAEKFVEWEIKTFDVYEEAHKLAEVEPKETTWTG